MAKYHRLFVSFAIEDVLYRDFLIGQSKNARTPFDFTDMSVKTPWSTEWKEKCRLRIKGCDGVIALVSKNTKDAAGALWEVKCAKEENIPVLGVYINSNDKPSLLPTEFTGIRVREWSWPNIKAFIDNL